MAIKSIGIDIRTTGVFGAGKAKYCEGITRALIRMAPDIQFYLFNNTINPAFADGSNYKQIKISSSKLLWHLTLRAYLKKNPVDFYFSPTSYVYPSIAPKGQKLSIVVHDLIAFLHPKTHHWFPILVERLTLGVAVKHSSFISTVSQNTWQDLNRIKPESKNKKMAYAPPFIDESMKKVETKNLDLPDKYILAVGTLEPRKNLQTLFKAFAILKNSDLHLCVVGGIGWKSSKIFKSIPGDIKGRIHFLGYRSSPELPEIYSRAIMLVYPSLYEGFGIPPLEAMACGCPVITSKISSLPEVVGDAAILIDPNNSQQIADSIETLSSEEIRSDLIKKGYERLRKFSWEKSAGVILENIRNLDT